MAILKTIEVSLQGKWTPVPAIEANGQDIVVFGKRLRIAQVHDEAWLESEIGDPNLYIETLKTLPAGQRPDLFTFTQKPTSTDVKYGFHVERESMAVAKLPSFQTWWEGLPQESRKNVRRAERRGVTVVAKPFSDDLITGIMDVNNDNPIRQGRPNAHYGKTFEQAHRDHCSFLDRCDFVCAYFGEEMIGYLKVVYRGEVASILNLAPKASHADKRPGNAMVAKAMELCAARGVTMVTYGNYRYGNKEHNPLLEFKIRNGFEEVLVPRYYVPLTVRGQAGMRLGFHRGLLGILPNSVIMQLVSARAKWYKIRESAVSRCSSMVERPNSTRQTGCSNPPAGSNT